MVEKTLLTPTGDISALLEMGTRIQDEASSFKIHNVFDDGGYKELVLLRLFNLTKERGRTGNDAVDANGRTYEIKTVARVDNNGMRKPRLSITTEHTLTDDNLRRYRSAHLWIVAVFDQAKPEVIYEIAPAALETYFQRWENRLRLQHEVKVDGGAAIHVNNPHIPIKFIARHGTQVWPDGPMQLRLGD